MTPIKNTARSFAIVALGSNLGDKERNLESAVEMLDSTEGVRVVKASAIITTTPVGGPSGQPVFSNGAVLVETSLAPIELLHVLQGIEKELRRVRLVFWGPRTIDLDLIQYDDVVMDTDELKLPHPRVYWRSFVLDPVCEIAPNTILPTSGLSYAETRRLLYWTFKNFELVCALVRRNCERAQVS